MSGAVFCFMVCPLMFCFTMTNTGKSSWVKTSETRSQDKCCPLCCLSSILGAMKGNKQDFPERRKIGWKYIENHHETLPKTVSIKPTSQHCHLIRVVPTLMTMNLENWVKGDSAGKQYFWVSKVRKPPSNNQISQWRWNTQANGRMNPHSHERIMCREPPWTMSESYLLRD